MLTDRFSMWRELTAQEGHEVRSDTSALGLREKTTRAEQDRATEREIEREHERLSQVLHIFVVVNMLEAICPLSLDPGCAGGSRAYWAL